MTFGFPARLILVLVAASLAGLLIWRWQIQKQHAPREFGALEWKIEDIKRGIGRHHVLVDSVSRQIIVQKNDIEVFATPKNQAFIGGAFGGLRSQEYRGSFSFSYNNVELCKKQSVEEVRELPDAVEVNGKLLCKNQWYDWKLIFSENKNGDLDFEIATSNELNRLFIRVQSRPSESIYGAGAQFTHYDLKGRRVPLWISEQGIGRGAEPLTTLVNLVARSGGDEFSTYMASSAVLTSEFRAFFIRNSGFGELDSTTDKILFDYWSNRISGIVIARASPKELMTAMTDYTGRMRPLPDWIHRGAVVGIQGGTEKVRQVLRLLENSKVQIAAVWLQDWVGQRRTSFGKQLWWNWNLNRSHYPDWEKFLEELSSKKIKVMGYINPFLAEIPADLPHQNRLRDEALAKGYLVKSHAGTVLDILNTDFKASLVDLTNPEARHWLKDIIKKHLVASGFYGWMADFGEALPTDALLFENDASNFHNNYAVEWAKLNREAIDSLKNSDQYVFFTRAGFSESPRYSTLFWLGDQMVTWDQFDGLKSTMTSLLSSGLSGVAFNHSDIGGYTSIRKYFLRYTRSEELLVRWMELNAFTAIFRSHEGNLPDDNLQVYSNEFLRTQFAKNAELYSSLFEYRKQLIDEAASKGWPMVRSMWFEYPQVEEFKSIHSQFMLGDRILVAPVMAPGKSTVSVYFPKGRWKHLLTGEIIDVADPVQLIVKAPLGQPAVYTVVDE